ncbi:peptidase domain-containing ABC transporter [Dactylosporangium sp. CA-092794]|uniref:peptidase domain-containing ABC transporter n=1 Tax=Dactylosporangium sp. CA-092794 TaxID=3239929 RepID=UPI003D93FDD3
MRRRVPLRQQLTITECAAACLAMVASYHGRFTTVSGCRGELAAGRNGLTVAQIVRAADRMGLAAEVTADLPEDPALPAIVFWRRRHFVVVERVGRDWVRIADPGNGRRRIPRTEFAEHFSGVAMTLRPTEDFVRRRSRVRDWPLVRYLRDVLAVPGTRTRMAGILAASAALQLVGLAFPVATGFTVDRLIPRQRWELVPLLITAVTTTVLLFGATSFLRARLLVNLRARANVVLTRAFVTHLLRLPLRFFLQRSRGDLLMRLSSVATTREALTGQLFTVLFDAVLLGLYLGGLVVLSPAYLGLTLAIGAAQGAILLGSYRRSRRLAQREISAMAEEQSYLVETLEAMLPLKANGAEPSALRRWSELFDKFQDATVRRGRTSATVESLQAALRTLAPLALLTLGVVMVLRGELTVGTMLAANSIAASVLAPLGSFISAGQSLQLVRAQVERMYDVLDAPVEPVGAAEAAQRHRPAAVELTDVSFSYDQDGEPVLRDVCLTLAPGRKVGVAGRTGSGKSTLALLVLGLLRPGQGEVRVDGLTLDAIDLHQLRGSCGAVLQDLSLFSGSIEENIRLGRPDAGPAEIEAAAQVAGLDDDVARMPMGYHTQVGEGGLALSAGQRQRVALARALVHRPRLLVLDEATSHLDPATERRVDEALNRLEVTRLVISHRRSAIENADEILVLDGARVVERGRHGDLMRRRGHYFALFGDHRASREEVSDTVPAPRAGLHSTRP